MSAHTDDFHERLEGLARAVVETRSAYHLGENGPDGLDLSFAYDDAVSAFHRASHPHENTILKLIAERDALRAGLEEIINECPASCETSPAHNMADIARQLLTPRSETPTTPSREKTMTNDGWPVTVREHLEVARKVLRAIPNPSQSFVGEAVVYSISDDVPEDIAVALSYIEAALALSPSKQTGDLSGIVNAAVDDLSIEPSWHIGKSRGEVEFIQAVLQNGVEVAADAILAARQEGATQ